MAPHARDCRCISCNSSAFDADADDPYGLTILDCRHGDVCWECTSDCHEHSSELTDIAACTIQYSFRDLILFRRYQLELCRFRLVLGVMFQKGVPMDLIHLIMRALETQCMDDMEYDVDWTGDWIDPQRLLR